MARSLTGFLLGVAWKVLAVGIVSLCGVLVMSWYRDRPLNCQGPLVGQSRGEAGLRARRAGLLVSFGSKKDEVAGTNHGIGLSWCVLSHDGTNVTNAKFVRE
jgi:hypothetical protein